MSRIPVEEFLKLAEEIPVIDVRTPSEHKSGHIPGSHNIPLFSDEDRVKVGTDYKQRGKKQAILLGLELAGPRMKSLIEQAEPLTGPGGKLLVHCWRGGMRSESVSWLYNLYGIQSDTLEGGYKSFREFVRNINNQSYSVLVLGGYTGSKKTEILGELKRRGEAVIDLEALASHRGSVFGHLGMESPPTQEHFENLLAMELQRIPNSKRIWVEDESRHVGRIVIPRGLFQSMQSAPVVFVDVDRESRVRHLVSLYGESPSEILTQPVDRIKKRLGGVHTKAALNSIEQNDYQTAARTLLNYYDQSYEHGLARRNAKIIERLSFSEESIETMADALQEKIK